MERFFDSLFFVFIIVIVVLESLMEIHFACHIVHPFKMYNPMVFSIFSELCNHPHNLTLEHCEKVKLQIQCHNIGLCRCFISSCICSINCVFLEICLFCLYFQISRHKVGHEPLIFLMSVGSVMTSSFFLIFTIGTFSSF